MCQVNNSGHGFANPYIKGVDSRAHGFHKGDAFALDVGDLKQARFEARRALKTNGDFGVVDIGLTVVEPVPRIVELLLVVEGQHFVKKLGEHFFAFDAGVGFEFRFFFFGEFVVPERTVGQVIVGNVDG